MCGLLASLGKDREKFWNKFFNEGRELLICMVALSTRHRQFSLAMACIGLFSTAYNTSSNLWRIPYGTRFTYLWILVYTTLGWALETHHSQRKAFGELRNQWDGSCADASCTVEEDERAIWSDIGPYQAQVDTTIGQLFSAGMSSRALRQASAKGVNIKNFCRFNLPRCLIGWGCWILDNITREYTITSQLRAFNIALALAWAISFYASDPDERVFQSLVVVKLYWLFQVLPFFLWKKLLVELWGLGDIKTYRIVEEYRYAIQGVICVLLCSLGLGQLLQRHKHGRLVAQAIINANHILRVEGCKTRWRSFISRTFRTEIS
jgi:hypothetical protein